ncbi:esterase/lipase family protein [Goodfellowiella coeruleoviolacea]|nr:alpha/beta fold hydrolase [Goodfellowiella coeruleoviolacea]
MAAERYSVDVTKYRVGLFATGPVNAVNAAGSTAAGPTRQVDHAPNAYRLSMGNGGLFWLTNALRLGAGESRPERTNSTASGEPERAESGDPIPRQPEPPAPPEPDSGAPDHAPVEQSGPAPAEPVGGVPGVVGDARAALRALASAGGLRGLVVEAAWLAAHAVLYPWGMATKQFQRSEPYGHYRTDHLPPAQRGLVVSAMAAAGTPVVLVHGIADNRSTFTVLSSALRRRGFGVVHPVNYSVLTALTGDVRAAAALLASQVERVCEQTGADHVHLVGHSLGGLIARYYVQRLGGDQRTHTLITLGTPHSGTLTAYLLPTPLLRQLRPGSALFTELDQPASGCQTRFVAVWSEMDQVVIPQGNARLRHPDLVVEEHQIRDSGHLSLPVDPRTVRLIVTALTRSGDNPLPSVVPVRGHSSEDPNT